MRDNTFLTPLLTAGSCATMPDSDRSRLWRALHVDPALAGRVRLDRAGAIVLTGSCDGPPPTSAKERERWELHVRLRLTAELGQAAASAAIIRWAELANDNS